ncbi:hypothetical protein TNIN_399391 [Trichonephila inaurata madagascariensis]|uniref:Uncharacterized protein n=1 Tax=Trichonephila inaurata madagascariensis TaxID=2747483 RepID=A0A8X7C1J6_9ARAC|nr:hypothetical protein TNIN_399391 [Trichonephila inaurata madagascariensis]
MSALVTQTEWLLFCRHLNTRGIAVHVFKEMEKKKKKTFEDLCHILSILTTLDRIDAYGELFHGADGDSLLLDSKDP